MITEEIREQIKEMYYNGRTKSDISDILGVSISSIRNILKHNNKITEEIKEEIKELYKQGLIKAKVARKLEVSWWVVHKVVGNNQSNYKHTPKKTREEIRREKEERNQRLKDSIKDEEVAYPTELDKCLAEIRYRDNHIEPPKTIITL